MSVPNEGDYLRLVAENIDAVLWLMSPDCTQVHYVSPAYRRIWGRPVEELYAAPFKWLQSVFDADQPRVLDAIAQLRTGVAKVVDFRIHHPDAGLRYIRNRSVPVTDADGAVVHVAVFSDDVTEDTVRARLSDESLYAQRDALVREVHHRIKNNLQGVTGLLRNYAGQHPEIASVMNEAVAQVQAVAIIHGLHGQASSSAVHLGDLLRQIVSGVAQLMRRELEVDFPKACDHCQIVVSDLEAVPVALVLNEMVFNAVKHGSSRATPQIGLALDIGAERATLSIANPGHLPDRRRRSDAARALGGAGLHLIRSLLPRRGAKFELTNDPDGVRAVLMLEPPILSVRC